MVYSSTNNGYTTRGAVTAQHLVIILILKITYYIKVITVITVVIIYDMH